MGGSRSSSINHRKPMQEVRVEQHYHQGAPRRILNPPKILIREAPTSKRSSRGHERDNPKRAEEKTRRKERVLGRRTRKRPMGLWNLGAIINRINTFPTNLQTEAMIPLEIAEQTTRVSAYDPEGNQSDRETEADLVSEIREEEMIKQQAVKKLLAAIYNKKARRKKCSRRKARRKLGRTLPSGRST
ncbi:hypothetical protein PIB30_078783 [Stylosanthes scabra]|uniref:Uncharacterized protein n=1 Tax=Stylosanthes scabra TaxID=79078 RepID=A0ABU6USP9_9FABA|nr:hypothetical protein [Stylosanthes scabra]